MQKISKIIPAAVALFFSIQSFAQDSTKTRSLDEVIVTGQYKPQSIKNSVYQVKSISSERIRLSGATNVQQVLNNQLGFRFSNDNTLGITDVQLNGMSGRNVKILLDGMPVLDRFDERVSLSQIDVTTIDHIEIVEGPMSVSYGTDAMGGVINIITKKNYLHKLTLTASAQEETAADEYHPFSYKGVHTQTLNAHYKQSNWNFNAGGSHVDFDGYGGDSYGRNKSWRPKEQWLGNGMIGYGNAKFNVYYRLDGMTETIKDRGTINIDPDIAFAKAVDKKYTTDRYMHQLQGSFRLNKKMDLASAIAYTDYKRATETLVKDFVAHTETPSSLDGSQDVSKLKSFSFKNTLQYQVSPKVSLQPGIDINYEKASGARIIGSPDITDYAFFVSSEIKPTSRIQVRPGIRVEQNSKYNPPPVIPSVNTKFILNKNLDLRLSYGYGFRAPVLRELYFQFVDANHNILGNPNLKAETSNSFNGSLTWTAPVLKNAVFSTVFGSFYNVFENQIVLTNNVNNPTEYSYYNADRTRTTGFSLDNKLNIKNAEFTLGFNYTGYAQTLDATAYKNDSRDFLWTPEINSNIIYRVPGIRTSFGLFYKFIGNKPAFSYETVGTQTGYFITKTGSYNLADFTITSKLHKYLSVSGGIKNIFDVTTVNNSAPAGSVHSSNGALSVNYGRSYFLGLAINFSKH